MRPLSLFLVIATTCVGFLHAEPKPETADLKESRQIFEREQVGGAVSEERNSHIERAKQLSSQPDTKPDGIDWERAKQLYQREQKAEKLNEEDQKYLDRAKAERRRQGGGGRGNAGAEPQRKMTGNLTPISDMSESARYEGEDGGLYGGGSNQPPEAHRKAAEAALAQIRPLTADGKPSGDGRIVFVSISMSNATMEFSTFKRNADASPLKSDKVTIVDCAQGGQAMAEWVDSDGRPWQEAMNRITNAKVTPAQVQVAWVKLANKAPSGSMKDHLAKLEADTTKVLQNAKSKFPNLRIAYLGSRIWAGNAKGGLNPEPYAYESAYGVRHLIQRQIKGEAALVDGKSPLLLWGPYLWAEGAKGRRLDDLKWELEDFSGDGVHPSESGRQKVARQLLTFFAGDALAKGWFAK